LHDVVVGSIVERFWGNVLQNLSNCPNLNNLARLRKAL
jgi:hypothetical protein